MSYRLTLGWTLIEGAEPAPTPALSLERFELAGDALLGSAHATFEEQVNFNVTLFFGESAASSSIRDSRSDFAFVNINGADLSIGGTG